MSPPDTSIPRQPGALSRRGLLGGALVGLAQWRLPPLVSAAAEPPPAPHPPAGWRTWLLTTGDELRPPPPAPVSPDELAELRDLQARRSATEAATVETWAARPAVLPWTDLALDLVRLHQPSPVRAGRALALLHVALADTVVAVWDARAATPRPAPAALDGALTPLGDAAPEDGSYPSEHAAIAAAAATVLAVLFPDEPAAGLVALADEAAASRLWAGTNVRGDIEAGQAIGRAVGQRAVARGAMDGSTTPWDGRGRPSGPGVWQPTPPGFVQQPADPGAGRWATWVVASGDQFRPAPPPAFGSPAWSAELAAVREAVARRTPEQEEIALRWAGGPGTPTPAGLWVSIARDLIVEGGLDLPHAARALALTTAAMADGFVCCWDAKFAYWTARPITADPTLDVLIPTPPFPSFTSGHATISAAAATVLGHLFPDEQATLQAQAEEAAASRVWAGIHFPVDSDVGLAGGRQIGRLVAARAMEDE